MRVLVTGAGGMLGRAVVRELERRGHDVEARERAALDVTDAAAVEAAVTAFAPDAVVQCAAYTRVDDAEAEEARAFAVNADGTRYVARACRAVGARLAYISTDYVFDGEASRPYRPDSPAAPLNAYGRSKLAGEAAAKEAGDWIIVRTSWLYGAGGRNFVSTILERARRGEPLRIVDDQRGTPTWTGSLAGVLVAMLERRVPGGIYHATGRGDTTWFGLACEALRAAGLDAEVTAVPSDAFPTAARRPRYSVLDCSTTEALVGPLPDWRTALAAALAEGGMI
ncbi:MAG TPA: dTDP-4-dehydrorhamnose reductase [Longimicrobiales bacterium]